jgi:hypothetical protein
MTAERKDGALRVLLVIHGLITLAAGVVLVAAPGAIPRFIDVDLPPRAFVLCYFLAGAEAGIAFLSFYAARSHQADCVLLAVLTIIIFHAATAALEIYALTQGASARLLSNMALRIMVVALFAYYGGPQWRTRAQVARISS